MPSASGTSEPHNVSAVVQVDFGSTYLAAQDTQNPVANAGEDITAYVNAVTVLNGSVSTDNVGVVNYFWTFTDGGPIFLTGENVTYVFTSTGSYDVTLNVSDAEGNWDTDIVTVTVDVDSTPPSANAGRNTTVYVDYTFLLSGRRSSHPATGWKAPSDVLRDPDRLRAAVRGRRALHAAAAQAPAVRSRG